MIIYIILKQLKTGGNQRFRTTGEESEDKVLIETLCAQWNSDANDAFKYFITSIEK